MSKYWSKTIRNIKPYTPGEQPRDMKYIKLNTNENPYPPSPKVMEAITRASGEMGENLRLYPDPTCDELRCAIADYYKLEKQQVFVGNGSDELLAFSFLAFFDSDRPVLFPDITYSFYRVYASLFRTDYMEVSLNDDFSIPVESFFESNGGIIIPNPNAPTGKLLPLRDIESILEKNEDSVVIIDEAYIDFGGESAVTLIEKYPNLLVIQTFSKSRSLAGLRIGMALGNKDLIEGLDRVKNSINSYTLDRIALAAAVQAIKDEKHFEETRRKIINTRERISKELVQIGFEVIDSGANFIFISHETMHARDIFKRLRDGGILVRYFNEARIDNYLRVSIGTDEDMDSFLKAIREIV